MWQFYAILSAIFAALVAILAKVGVQGIDSNLAVAVRTAVVFMLAWLIALATGGLHGLCSMTLRNWLFLTLSGMATGLSWLFYFKALQCGDASKVAPVDKLSVAITIIFAIVILGEPADLNVLAGGGLIVLGSLIIIING